jgi:hypothetical protein
LKEEEEEEEEEKNNLHLNSTQMMRVFFDSV